MKTRCSIRGEAHHILDRQDAIISLASMDAWRRKDDQSKRRQAVELSAVRAITSLPSLGSVVRGLIQSWP
jgi:hypothetical protein